MTTQNRIPSTCGKLTTGLADVAYYLERDTGERVEVESFYSWEGQPDVVSVRYSHGRKYGMTRDYLALHYTTCPDQEMFATAYGNVDCRPTANQLKLQPRPAQVTQYADTSTAERVAVDVSSTEVSGDI